MPTSSEKNQQAAERLASRRRIHPVLKAMLVVALIILFDILATKIFMPYASLGAISWEDFKNAEYVDTVLAGSSYAQRGLDPDAIDEVLETTSYSIATPGESLSDTRASIEEALKNEDIKTVVLGVGYETFTSEEWIKSHVPYLISRLQGSPPSEYVTAFADLMFSDRYFGTSDSLNCLFPFIYNPITSPSGVIENVKAQLAGKSRAEAAQGVIEDWHYHGRGYGNYTTELDSQKDTLTSMQVYGNTELLGSCLEELAAICDLCVEHGVQLIVVATPHPEYDILDYGEFYPNNMALVKAVVDDHGGTFLDFNMYEGGDLDLVESDFCDYQHLNEAGAAKFSTVLAHVISKIGDQQDASGDFLSYDEWKARLSQPSQP